MGTRILQSMLLFWLSIKSETAFFQV
jgi:hypothetical protein